MIDRETFKKIEGRLYGYFSNLRKIEALEYRCMVLEKAKEQLRQDIRNTNVSIDAELGMAIGYEERVQTSSTGVGHAERGIIKEISRLEKEWIITRREILKVHAKIREIKKNNSEIEYVVGLLDTQCRLITEMKYKDKLSLEEIGLKLNMDKSSISRLRERIVRDINKVINL